MKSLALLVAAFAIFMLLAPSTAYAADEAAGSSPANEEAVIDAGNAICPVTGDPVNGKDFYVYKGKRYGLCCPMCVSIFANDPEKYSAIADKAIAGQK